MRCVSSNQFTIKINGVGQGFEGKRGLRQGDSMSPLLFVLVMEYLKRTLKKLDALTEFQYHPMCKNTKLTCLIFTDDLISFCKDDLVSIQKIVETIKHFRVAIRLVANLENSNIYLAGVEDDVKQVYLI